MNPRDLLPQADDDRVFSEPWQAQAFAMTLALHQKGVFSWSEWAESLSKELENSGAEDGSDYYTCWLAALEKLLAAKSITALSDVDALAAAWQRAAHATPHGTPILLENDPQHVDRHNTF
ncbi:nitrile hydratase accessory protein [Chelativorans salis]|uniref:Nitrile hydratase accessory protein n=1 Tax=Chelativorans salis TaxID=2978478 RepID=A0ABT2LI95_9HYPH|nr:nitrile hydratase accessory protein [Chelativorans sp. EGI FJ00035]MCT7373724.1 nitrile hydratase accessory protein [Chelativorans sp. EGI FJ00035]